MADSYYDVIVIGAGITGLTAAKHAVQSGLTTANIEAMMFGGLVLNVNELDGETQGSGAELASDLMSEISDLGVANLSEAVTAIARAGDQLTVTTDAGTHRARAVIVASGAKLKRLGVPGEAEFDYKGVSQCADCDGPMCQDQDVVVVGGGDSALQEALVLAKFCKRVHLLHRGKQYRARRNLIDAISTHSNITPVWESVVEEILGGATVEKVRVRNIATNAVSEIACTGFFAYIGLEPVCDFVPAEVARDANGALVTNAALQTALPGVYAVGAVRSGYGGLLTHAIAEGEAAARSVSAALAG